jgi:hypothetical protein
MIYGLEAAINFANDIIMFYIILLILPYFIRFALNWIIDFIAWLFRLDRSIANRNKAYTRYNKSNRSNYRSRSVRNFLALITLPGTLVRVGITFLYLRLRGWQTGIGYPGWVGRPNRGIMSDSRTGFTIAMSRDSRRRITFREIVIIGFIGYLPISLSYFMWKNKADMIDFIIYISQGNMSEFWIYFWYYYMVFAMFVGGAPIPEETMTPVYYLLGEYPHLFFGLIGSWICGFFICLMEIEYLGFEGKRLGYVFFLLYSAILIFKVVLNQREFGYLTSKRLDELLLQMDAIELI